MKVSCNTYMYIYTVCGHFTQTISVFCGRRYVDYIQVMAYDFHGPWSQVTSFSSPLYSRGSNVGFNQQLSQVLLQSGFMVTAV